MGLKEDFRNGTTLEQRLKLKAKLGLNIDTEYKFGNKSKNINNSNNMFLDNDLNVSYNKFYKNFDAEVNKRKSFQYKTSYGHFREMPIIENMIMYETFHGNSMTDNPFALFLEIVKQDVEKKYIHVWVLSHKPEEDIQVQRFIEMENLYFVDLYSDEYLSAIARAKFLINNTSFPPYFFRREEQIYINTWHGTPLKTLGKDMAGSYGQHKNLARNFLQATHILSPNRFTGEKIIYSHDIDGVYQGEIIEEGYPRIDLAQSTTTKYLDDVLMKDVKFDKNKKTILYAPTWRGEVDSVGNINDELLEKVLIMKNSLPDNYQILLKVHPLLYKYVKNDNRFENIVISDYLDINEISAFIDVLITDYSSAFIDFLATKKPIILFQYDQEQYLADRGVYISLDKLSIPIITSDEELEVLLRDVDNLTSEYIEFDEFAYTQVGNSSEKIINHIFANQKVVTVDYSNSLKNILVWTGKLTNEKVYQINKLSVLNKNILLWHPAKVSVEEEECIKGLKRNIKIFYNVGEIVFDQKNYALYTLIRKNEVHQELITDAQQIFSSNVRRMFGSLHFETVIDFDGISDFWIQQFYYGFPEAKKILYLSLSDINKFETINKNVTKLIPMFNNVVSTNVLIRSLKLENTIKLEIDNDLNDYSFSEVNIDGKKYIVNIPSNDAIVTNFKSELVDSKFVKSQKLSVLILEHNRDKNLVSILDKYFSEVDNEKDDLVIYGDENQIINYLHDNRLYRSNILVLSKKIDINIVRAMFTNAKIIFDLVNLKYDNNFEDFTHSISQNTKIIKYDSSNVLKKYDGLYNTFGFNSIDEGIFTIKEFKHYLSLLNILGNDYINVLDSEFKFNTNKLADNNSANINNLMDISRS
ncbi:CDP-glycerol glycerophosphotransferase family protein [Weissella bombi]|uniref:CDP-glycerol glycerophosphotransferase family protein n=1 Tax=Weissella bombi TaxID=1505725 RepID=UPI003AF2A79A